MMIVLYPVLVLSLFAGQGLVSAEDATTVAPDTTTIASATASIDASKGDSLPSNESPTRSDAISTGVKVAKDLSTDELQKPIGVDNSDNVEKAQRALDKMTKALDVSTSEGTAAVPLLAGRNYDYFLLKLQKPEEKQIEKPDEGPKRSARNLDTEANDNSLERPIDCPCIRPPPHVAPEFNAMQNIYGKQALALNTIGDSPCPPGMVPVTFDGSFPPNHGSYNDPGLAYNNEYFPDYLPPNVSPNSPISGPRFGLPPNALYPPLYPPPYGQGPSPPYDQSGWLPYGHNPVNDPQPYYPQYPQFSQYPQYSPYSPHTPPQLPPPKDFPRPPSEFNSIAGGLRSLIE